MCTFIVRHKILTFGLKLKIKRLKNFKKWGKIRLVGQYRTLSDLPLNSNVQLKKMSIFWGLTKPNIMPKNCKNL